VPGKWAATTGVAVDAKIAGPNCRRIGGGSSLLADAMPDLKGDNHFGLSKLDNNLPQSARFDKRVRGINVLN
jgi:hypothetical protein